MGFASKKITVSPTAAGFHILGWVCMYILFSISNFLRQIKPHIKGSKGFYDRLIVSLWPYGLESHHPVVLKALQSDPQWGPPQTFREPNRTGIPLSSTTRGLSRWPLSCGRHKVLAPKKCSLSTFWLVGWLDYGIVDISFYSYCEYRWIILSSICPMDEPPPWAWFAKVEFFIGHKWRDENQ